MKQNLNYINAQANLHHALLLGLQLMVASNTSKEAVGDWMFRLFRRQHLEKFLPSFEKLGIADLPDAVACAQYHVISNSIGGVPVEYFYESDRKAWVRFRYPRWMYHGPTICGVPREVSQGFLDGWYAHNGVSLNNPKLGFVCVSEDMTGEFGFCGYFREFDQSLSDGERLQFARGEQPPRFISEEQPMLPAGQWDEVRLAKAKRNYAIEFIRNGITELTAVIGLEKTQELASRAAKLIGLQYLQETLEQVEVVDGSVDDAATYLQRMLQGLGDQAQKVAGNNECIVVKHSGLRVLRGLDESDSQLVLNCWRHLWVGAMASFQQMKNIRLEISGDELLWKITEIEI